MRIQMLILGFKGLKQTLKEKPQLQRKLKIL